MEIKAYSDPSYEAYKIFFDYTTRANKILYIVLESVMAFAILVCLISMFSLGLQGLKTAIPFVAMYLICVFIRTGAPKTSYKRTCVSGEVREEFIFTPHNIHIFTAAKGIRSQTDVSYSAVVRVYETERYVFLYIANDRAYIVDKTTVTGGNFDTVRDILYRQLDNKYVIKFK